MVSQEDANGNFLLYEMDETGLLKTVTTDKNQSLKMQYNDQNLLKEIELADGTKMQYTYDTAGDLTNAAHVSADGNQSVQEPYAYDKEHHMTAITDAEGNDYGVTYEGERQSVLPNRTENTSRSHMGMEQLWYPFIRVMEQRYPKIP